MKKPWIRAIRFFLPWPRGDWTTEPLVTLLTSLAYLFGFVFVVLLGTCAAGVVANLVAAHCIPLAVTNLSLYEVLTTPGVRGRALENTGLWSVIFFWLEIIVIRIWGLTVDDIAWVSAKGTLRAKRRANKWKELQGLSQGLPLDWPYGS